MHEDMFKYSPDPVKQKIYKERIQPYIQEPIFQASLSIELYYA